MAAVMSLCERLMPAASLGCLCLLLVVVVMVVGVVVGVEAYQTAWDFVCLWQSIHQPECSCQR